MVPRPQVSGRTTAPRWALEYQYWERTLLLSSSAVVAMPSQCPTGTRVSRGHPLDLEGTFPIVVALCPCRKGNLSSPCVADLMSRQWVGRGGSRRTNRAVTVGVGRCHRLRLVKGWVAQVQTPSSRTGSVGRPLLGRGAVRGSGTQEGRRTSSSGRTFSVVLHVQAWGRPRGHAPFTVHLTRLRGTSLCRWRETPTVGRGRTTAEIGGRLRTRVAFPRCRSIRTSTAGRKRLLHHLLKIRGR